MAKGKPQQDQNANEPPPEMVMAYAIGVREVISLAQFSMWCGVRPAGTVRAHRSEAGCIEVAELGQCLVFVEGLNEDVVIGAQRADAPIFDNMPLVCLAIKENELFFITRELTLNGVTIPAIGISVGKLLYGDLAIRFAEQSTTRIHQVNLSVDGEVPDATVEQELVDGAELPILPVARGAPVMKAWEALKHSMAMTGEAKAIGRLQSHFLG